METKEAIFILKHKRYTMNNIDDIISLLQQGEEYQKYHSMWLSLQKKYLNELTDEMGCDCSDTTIDVIEVLREMDMLKQKYFPKMKNYPYPPWCTLEDYRGEDNANNDK